MAKLLFEGVEVSADREFLRACAEARRLSENNNLTEVIEDKKRVRYEDGVCTYATLGHLIA